MGFERGQGRINLAGRRVMVVGVMGVYEVMEWVLTRPAKEDETYQQKEYRRWLRADPKGFMAKRLDMEKLRLGGGVVGVGGMGDGGVVRDVETEEILGLIGKVRGRMGGG